jgi:hypothetical protein
VPGTTTLDPTGEPETTEHVMSLWTPGGEVPVNRGGNSSPRAEPQPDPRAAGAAGLAGAPSLDDLSPEDRAKAEEMIREMAQVQQQIAETPAAQLVANHAMGLYELAAIKLSQEPPLFAEAQLAIDVLAAVLDTVGDRLGGDTAALRQGLSQLQMAFVELRKREQATSDDTSS